MGEGIITDGAAEWRKHWYLPLVAALGFSTAGLQTHAMGPFIGPLQQDFGWTRAQISFGLTICNFGTIFLVPLMGVLIDRWGPRRVGLVGVLLAPGAFALLGTATGTMTSWLILWAGIAVGMMWVPGTVWTSAVASRFDAGRGMAIAVTISGGSLSAVILPPLGTWLIHAYGWRYAFAGLGGIWALMIFPLVYLFFRGAEDHRVIGDARAARAVDTRSGLRLTDGLRMPAFYTLMLAGGSFAFAIIGIIVHLVPILTGYGAASMTAAGIASLAGIFSIVGRLATGALLDRFPGYIIGAGAYLLPILGCALLLVSGTDFISQVTAAAVFGLTMGSELDIVIYLATRYFGLRNLGVMLGAVMSAIGVGLAFGPLAAGATFDRFHSYAPFLVVTIGLMGVSALAVASLRRTPVFTETAQPASSSKDLHSNDVIDGSGIVVGPL